MCISLSTVPRSPQPEVSMGGIVCLFLCVTPLRLHVRRLIMFACRKVFTTNEMSKINATINISEMFETIN